MRGEKTMNGTKVIGQYKCVAYLMGSAWIYLTTLVTADHYASIAVQFKPLTSILLYIFQTVLLIGISALLTFKYQEGEKTIKRLIVTTLSLTILSAFLFGALPLFVKGTGSIFGFDI
jgi:hypothetical protein